MVRYFTASAIAILFVLGAAIFGSLLPIQDFARDLIVMLLGSPELARPNIIGPLTPDLRAACALGFRPWEEQSPVERYWPAERFGEPSGEFVSDWYSTQLCAMGEAPLVQPSGNGTVIRFLWLRSFHPGIAVRVERRDPETKLVAVELSGKGGYAPGAPARREERPLSDAEWAEIERAVDQSRFWRLSTTNEVMGLDGAQWVVEISEARRYHLVDRWSGGEVERIGRELLALSGLDPDPIY